MKLVHISDTHLRDFPELPEGDILIHSGDALNMGTDHELIKFRNQLNNIKDKFKHIIYIPGNHDWCFENNYKQSEDFLKELIPNITILHNQGIELEGYKIYGTADQPEFCSWAFNLNNLELAQTYLNIPNDTNILITHCPPKGILDFVINTRNINGIEVGCQELKQELPRLKNLKAHLFGHIHYSSGQKSIDNIIYSNGSICNEYYQSVNPAQIITIDK